MGPLFFLFVNWLVVFLPKKQNKNRLSEKPLIPVHQLCLDQTLLMILTGECPMLTKQRIFSTGSQRFHYEWDYLVWWLIFENASWMKMKARGTNKKATKMVCVEQESVVCIIFSYLFHFPNCIDILIFSSSNNRLCKRSLILSCLYMLIFAYQLRFHSECSFTHLHTLPNYLC